MSDPKGNQKSDSNDKQRDDRNTGEVDKHYTRSSDDARAVIIGKDNDSNHGHIVYDKGGDVVYIRGEGTSKEDAQYDTRRGDNVDDPNWPNT